MSAPSRVGAVVGLFALSLQAPEAAACVLEPTLLHRSDASLAQIDTSAPGAPVVVAAIPRLSSTLVSADKLWPLGAEAWGDTVLSVPAGIADRRYRNALTGEVLRPRQQEGAFVFDARNLFRHLPVALLAG